MQFSLAENHLPFAFIAVSDLIVVVKVQFLPSFAVFFIPHRTGQGKYKVVLRYIIITKFHMFFFTHSQ